MQLEERVATKFPCASLEVSKFFPKSVDTALSVQVPTKANFTSTWSSQTSRCTSRSCSHWKQTLGHLLFLTRGLEPKVNGRFHCSSLLTTAAATKHKTTNGPSETLVHLVCTIPTTPSGAFLTAILITEANGSKQAQDDPKHATTMPFCMKLKMGSWFKHVLKHALDMKKTCQATRLTNSRC